MDHTIEINGNHAWLLEKEYSNEMIFSIYFWGDWPTTECSMPNPKSLLTWFSANKINEKNMPCTSEAAGLHTISMTVEVKESITTISSKA